MMNDTIQELQDELAVTTAEGARIDLLNELSLQWVRLDPRRSLALAVEAMELAERGNDAGRLPLALMRVGGAHRTLGSYAEALDCFAEAAELAGQRRDWTIVASACHGRGLVHFDLQDYPSAMPELARALEIRERRKDHQGAAETMNAMAVIHGILGDVPRALELLNRCRTIWEREGRREKLAMLLNNIGNLYLSVLDEEKGLEYYTGSLALRREMGDTTGEAGALMNIGVVHQRCGRFVPALEYFNAALAMFRRLEDRRSQALLLANIGFVQGQLGELDRAFACSVESLAIGEAMGLHELNRNTAINIGYFHLQKGDLVEALRHLEGARSSLPPEGHPEQACRIYETLAAVHQRSGEAEKALEWYTRYMEIRGAIESGAKQRMVSEAQARFEMERIEKERELYRRRAEGLESAMEDKRRELITMALQLVEKSELLGRLRSQLQEGMAHRSSNADRARLIAEIGRSLGAGDQWEQFQKQLALIHHDVIRALSERCPALTPTELKICALVRINLSSKEIASLLHSSARTVEKHRDHIRKKLGLPSRAGLVTFLASLPAPPEPAAPDQVRRPPHTQ